MFRKILKTLLAIVLCIGLLVPNGLPVNAQAPQSKLSIGVPIETVPAALVQRAAQFLEDMRGNKEIAPGWNETSVISEVFPLYRPDIREAVAYYEFIIFTNQQPSGYIVLSNGEHDFPIPHWDSQDISPTKQLDALAAKPQAGAQTALQVFVIAKYYRLDALSYAGEDVDGKNAIFLNDSPMMITGIDPKALFKPIEVSLTSFTPPASADDAKPPSLESDFVRGEAGSQKSGINILEWPSWTEFKTNYNLYYGVLLDKLALEAGQDYLIERNIATFGERIGLGDVRQIALLCTDVVVEVSGTGDELVVRQMVDRAGLYPLYRVSVIKDQFGSEFPLDLSFTCPGFGVQTFHFVITPPTFRMMLPITLTGSSPGLTSVKTTATVAPVVQNFAPFRSAPVPRMNWTPWAYDWVWAGTGDARLYNQMTANSDPNTTSCYSGCGATAWSMLMGWADYAARSTNSWSYWKPRFGIYRVDGGYGWDATAPLYMDTGIRSITWEIRNRIGTFCAFSSGATFPWNMGNAYGYLVGRSGTRVETHYNVFGISDGGLRDYAIRSIRYRGTPAIIGTGWLSHYPLAMGYASSQREVRACDFCWWNNTEYSRWFWVNQGWGGSGNGWVSASTWFAGELYP